MRKDGTSEGTRDAGGGAGCLSGWGRSLRVDRVSACHSKLLLLVPVSCTKGKGSAKPGDTVKLYSY